MTKPRMSRPSKQEYYMGIALQVAKRGTCLRRNYGAVIVKSDQIISTGYTGSPRGARNCIDIGYCFREQQGVPAGERYELCRSVHAEMNAVIHAARSNMLGSTLYLVGVNAKTGDELFDCEPCKLCKRVIINAGISYVITKSEITSVQYWVDSDWIGHRNIL